MSLLAAAKAGDLHAGDGRVRDKASDAIAARHNVQVASSFELCDRTHRLAFAEQKKVAQCQTREQHDARRDRVQARRGDCDGNRHFGVLRPQFHDPYTADTPSVEKAIARNLVEQANHWYHTCLQDKNAQMRMQHISYANAYVHAARHAMNDADLERATGTDVHGLQSVIEHTQQTSLKDLHKHCPRLKPSATSSTPSSKRSWA